MKNHLFLFTLVLIFSCSPDLVLPEKAEFNVMNLENMDAGQKFYYILLLGESYRDGTGEEYRYTGDTLEVEILGKSDDGYVIAERITEGSHMKTTGKNYYWENNDTTYINNWYVKNGSLKVVPVGTTVTFAHHGSPVTSIDSDEPEPPSNPNNPDETEEFFGSLSTRSHLMFNRDLILEPRNNNKTEVSGWKTTCNYFEKEHKELYVTDYELNGNQYHHLNVFIDYSHEWIDGPGYTTFYSKEYGIIRTSQHGVGRGQGWDKL